MNNPSPPPPASDPDAVQVLVCPRCGRRWRVAIAQLLRPRHVRCSGCNEAWLAPPAAPSAPQTSEPTTEPTTGTTSETTSAAKAPTPQAATASQKTQETATATKTTETTKTKDSALEKDAPQVASGKQSSSTAAVATGTLVASSEEKAAKESSKKAHKKSRKKLHKESKKESRKESQKESQKESTGVKIVSGAAARQKPQKKTSLGFQLFGFFFLLVLALVALALWTAWQGGHLENFDLQAVEQTFTRLAESTHDLLLWFWDLVRQTISQLS